MTLSQRCLTRNATFDGAPDSSLLGIESVYFFWFAKRSSNPPLRLLACESLVGNLAVPELNLDRQRTLTHLGSNVNCAFKSCGGLERGLQLTEGTMQSALDPNGWSKRTKCQRNP